MENSNNTKNDTNHDASETNHDTSNTTSNDANDAGSSKVDGDPNHKSDSKKFGWDKVREFFEEFELSNQGMQYPMTIITVSCVVIAVCVIFMTFTQLKLLQAFQKLYVISRYGF
jgi:hypothetical protein